MSNLQSFILNPLDTLFFRDARPMETGVGSGGHGANWPLPTTIYKALRTALLMEARTVPIGRTIKHHKKRNNGKVSEKHVASDLFRSLHTLGPFPVMDNAVYLPMPADVTAETDQNGQKPIRLHVMVPMAAKHGMTNFPVSWLVPVCSPIPASKSELSQWITVEWFRNYLAGSDLEVPPEIKPFGAEHRIGVKIDDLTMAAAEHKLYAAEHLRMAGGFGIWIGASLNQSDVKGAFDGVSLDSLSLKGSCITVGGEGRLCRLHKVNGNPLSRLEDISVPGTRVKWTLVTPACFNAGWRPNWVSKTDGRVLLKNGKTEEIERREGENRLAWRNRVRMLPEVNAKLVAARIPKPMHVSGWDVAAAPEKKQGPKPTQLLVPPGSVYYFEADSVADAQALIKALNGRTLSDRFGEAGMGLGFCGSWKPFEN